MAPMKRPAASTSGPGKKHKGPSVSKQCKEIASSMKGAEGYPPQVLKMISENLVTCLSDFKEDRHEFQARLATMAEEVMASIKASIEKKIAEAEEKLGTTDTEKATREAAVEETKKMSEEKAKALETSKQEHATLEAELKEATKALKMAEQEQKAGDAKLAQDEVKKVKLEAAIQSVFMPCKEGALEEAAIKKGVTDLQKLGKQYEFDTALLTSLPSALSKEPSARGTFDNVVVKQVEDELQSRLKTLVESLGQAEPGKEERAAKVATCKSALESLKVKQTEVQKAQKEAMAAAKVAEVAAKAAAKALKAFFPEMKLTTKELKEAKESLEDFVDGALKTFTLLLHATKPVEEAEPEAPEPEAAS